jgi:hypothetical protein
MVGTKSVLAVVLPAMLLAGGCTSGGGGDATADLAAPADAADVSMTMDVGTDAAPMDTGPADTGGTTDTGGADHGASAAAMYFCMGYQSICTFGATGGYPDLMTCLSAYDGYSMSRQMCVANELGMAASNPAHCAGASGFAPCN